MSKNNSSASSGGIGFAGLLAVLFIGLKLGGVIAWSWWWVLSPIWLPITVVLSVIVAGFVLVFFVGLVKKAFQ